MKTPLPVPAPRALALLLLAAVATSANAAVEIAKSPNDPRVYEYLELDNGLRAIVVSDPETDKAAASLDVHVGSGSDPEGREGLAHFLEHMLFLGTEKYPDPGEYKDFIDRHGGRDNAYTSFDHTNYFFDVDAAHLEPALDRFAQFFVAPVFNPTYVERERQVVHSEFTSKRDSDGRRIFSAYKQALNPDHPYSTFSVGNADTLADPEQGTIRDELIGFYREHYSAGIMTLVVLGREPTAKLREWVEAKFSGVPNTGAGPLAIEEPLFEPGALPSRLAVTPVKETRALSFSFPVPPLEEHYREKPVSHIAHLLGHEGEGSVLSELKRRGWADGLSAGAGFEHESAATFSVNVSLTEEGLAHVPAIADLIFAYLRLIERDGVERWIFDENRRLADIRFRFQEKGSSLGTARGIADRLHRYPPEDVLRGPYLHTRFDADLIRRYLERLRPGNVLVTVVAPGVQTDATTPHYGTPYALGPIDETLRARWRAATLPERLALPSRNPFIPENLALEAPRDPAPVPVRIDGPEGVELWHQHDTEFEVPRADFYVSLRSPIASDTPRHAVLTELFVDMVNDRLNEFAYPAHLAGLSYDLYRHLRGMTVRVSGYSDKQDMLLERITGALRDPRLAADRFEVIRAESMRALRNLRENSPYELGLRGLRDLALDPRWSAQARLAELETVTLAELRGFAANLLGELEVVALAHGNLLPSDAATLARIVARDLAAPARPVEVASARVVKIDAGTRWLRPLESRQRDSAALLYLQGPEKSLAARARIGLLGQMTESPFFEELRTEKRLGYVVFASAMTMLEVPGLAFVVQSPIATPEEIARHVESFLQGFEERLARTDEAVLERHRRALLTRLLEEETSLRERTDRYWNELDRGHTDFDLRARLAEEVRAVTLADLRATYDRVTARTARRELAVHVSGRAHARADEAAEGGERHAADAPRVVRDPAAFKRANDRFPP